ncbi:MAG: Guanine deaminase [Methanothrix harundinacea]|uniref:Guanine deaminase n=1 Tax=Methanothrix harundinacea TaxID=301375 RepID=A0A101FRV2_9EURY|nr:MAG: Guanine deaminase [Methanothrix harundinacea]
MNEFMAIALEEAMEGIENDDGGPFGAVIVQDGVPCALPLYSGRGSRSSSTGP